MRIAGRSFGGADARLIVLPAIAIAGCATWMMLPWPSDAGSQSEATPTAIFRLAQDTPGSNVEPTIAAGEVLAAKRSPHRPGISRALGGGSRLW